MAESTTDLFDLLFDEINSIKKKDLAIKIEKLKGKKSKKHQKLLWSSISFIRKSRETYGVKEDHKFP